MLKTVFTVAFCGIAISIYGHRLWEWWMTGQLYITTRFTSHYSTFSGGHIEFLIGFFLYVVLSFGGLLLIATAIADNKHSR
jgi:hypothetical protein